MTDPALISVIIPCFNQGRYLATAIESVLSQSYPHHEVIVVDDGSADDTRTTAGKYTHVQYVHQPNAGLSAARNKGIEKSSGQYLVFLDADDWLLPGALYTNLLCMQQNPEAALVSGGYQLFFEENSQLVTVETGPKKLPYCYLLECNYIAMIGAVLFRRRVLEQYRFDTALTSCEDYDLYLRIVRSHRTVTHNQTLAVYRLHQSNMSNNYRVMLENVLLVLARQKPLLADKTEEQWYQKGIASWTKNYTEKMYYSLLDSLYTGNPTAAGEAEALAQHNQGLYLQFLEKKKYSLLKRRFRNIKAIIRKALPARMVHRIKTMRQPTPKKVNLGDLARTQPFSTVFGYDRGGPIDRYYIENFLEKNKAVIKGRVLEIEDDEYTLRFGGQAVTTADILHIDGTNPRATFIGDLSHAPHLPDNSFDCIVLTQTLHLIYDYKAAIATCHRLLKPGGALLLTVPGISHIAQDQWGSYWLWSFTGAAVSRVLAESFPPQKITVETFGNVLAASAFLYGLGRPELTTEQLDVMDPHYQLLITAVAIK